MFDLIVTFFVCSILVEIPKKKLTKDLLDTKNVYILDCWSEIFIWYVKIFRVLNPILNLSLQSTMKVAGLSVCFTVLNVMQTEQSRCLQSFYIYQMIIVK